MILITRLCNFAARPLVRNILKVLTGNIGGNLLNIVTMAWLGIALGKVEYGLLGALTAATMMLLAQLSDFGLNTTIVKYYRDCVTAGREGDAEALMRRTFWIRLAIVSILAAVCIIFAHPIVALWLKRPDLAGLFRLAAVGMIGAALWSFCQSAMQARQQFTLYAVLTSANHLLRLALVWLAIHFHVMNLTVALAILAAVPLLGAISSVRLWPARFWTARMEPGAMARQLGLIFHFSKWIFISSVITTVIMRLDILLLGWFQSPDLGQYNMAMQLAQGIPLITGAVSAVLLPKLAATRRRAEIRRLVGIFIKSSPLLLVFILAIIAGAHLIVPLLKHGEYTPCLPVFDLLVVGSSLSIILNPISFFCLALDRARWLTWMNAIQLILSLAFSLILIPRLGAVGAGISALLVRLCAVVWLAVLYPKLLKLAD